MKPMTEWPQPREVFFPTNLYILRVDAGLTQQAFAELSGMSQRTVSYAETNKSHPRYATAKQIADFYEVSLDDLMFFDMRKGIPRGF